MQAVRQLGAALAVLVQLAAPAWAGNYRLESATVLPGSVAGWESIAFDAARSHLFIARQADGLTVFDVRANAVVAQVAGTRGARGIVLLPQFDRAYVANTDGTMTTIALSTLTLLKWEMLDEGGLDSIVFEPTTGELHAIGGLRGRGTRYITLDAKNGRLLRRTDFSGVAMGKPASDGKGALYAPMRDRNLLARLSAADLRVLDAWPLAQCVEPSVVEYEHASQRVFVGCRGERPVFVALDPASGKVVAALPAGRGMDGMAFDPDNRLVFTANGADANLAVIRQLGPDRYEAVETIGTRPLARVLAMDPSTRKLFTVTAGFSVPAAGQAGEAPRFHPDSFTVLAYAPAREVPPQTEHEHDH